MKRAGESIEFKDLVPGMLVTAKSNDVAELQITGRVHKIDGGYTVGGRGDVEVALTEGLHAILGNEHDDWTLAEDFPNLPRVQGLYVADYTLTDGATKVNRLGEWTPGAAPEHGDWKFRPVGGSIFGGIPESRVSRLVPVTVVPDLALEDLAIFQHGEGLGSHTEKALAAFFAAVNEVQD